MSASMAIRRRAFSRRRGAIDLGVEFTTMSKGYNMAGWRVGFAVGNPEMLKALTTVKAYYDYGMFLPIQIAAIMALRHTDAAVEAQSQVYANRRNVLCEGLRRLGWEMNTPRAACSSGPPFPALDTANGLGAVCDEAARRRGCRRQPRRRLRPGRRRLSAHVARGKRKSLTPGHSSYRPLPGPRAGQRRRPHAKSEVAS